MDIFLLGTSLGGHVSPIDAPLVNENGIEIFNGIQIGTIRSGDTSGLRAKIFIEMFMTRSNVISAITISVIPEKNGF